MRFVPLTLETFRNITLPSRDVTLNFLGSQLNETVILPKDLDWDIDELNVMVREAQLE